MRTGLIQGLIVVCFVGMCLWIASLHAEHDAKLHIPDLVTTADFKLPEVFIADTGDPLQETVFLTITIKDRDLFNQALAQMKARQEKNAKRK